MLEKKQIQAIFLLEFKMGYKVAETTRNINNAFSPGTANKHTVQSGSRRFAKETRALKTRSSGQPSEVDNDNWQSLSKLILLQLYEKLPKNSTWTILWLFGIWSKLERWKHSISGCLKSWLQKKKKKLSFWSVLFYATAVNHFSIRLWCAIKSGFYTTTGNNHHSGWTEKKVQSTSQSQTCTKKRSWSLLGGLLPIWSTTAFWILAKPLHLRNMLSK